MTRRKENVLILICTLVLVLLLTLCRGSKLTMQEDTGPLPEGQRSMKPVELYVGSNVSGSLRNMITAFELAHGVQIQQIAISAENNGNTELPELNSSRLILLSELRKSKLSHIEPSWSETPIIPAGSISIEAAKHLTLLHYPLEKADPNVMEVVNYLSGTNQARFLYSDKPE